MTNLERYAILKNPGAVWGGGMLLFVEDAGLIIQT
jgi:hypothetical protein